LKLAYDLLVAIFAKYGEAMIANTPSRLLSALALSLLLCAPASQAKKSADEKAEEKSKSTDAATTGSADDSPAPCASWTDPLNPPRAALLCIHGLGLNSDAYRNIGRRLSHRGISVYAIDVRGFGSWMRSNGNTQLDFDATLRDIKNTLETIHRANPGLPVFLLGESMGGAIALRAASMYPQEIQGLISAVPAGDRFGQKKEDLKVALDVLGHGLHKEFDIGKSIVTQATQNTKQQKEWETDPLNRMDLSAAQLMQFQHFMNDNIPAAKKITDLPVLLVQGTLDKLVRPEGSWQIFEAIESKEKSFLAFPSEHLIFEYGGTKTEADARKSAQIAATWIYEHLSDKGSVPPSYTAMRSMLTSPGSEVENADEQSPNTANHPLMSDAMHKAIDLYNKNAFADAVTAFQAVVGSDPNNVDAHIWLGLSYEKTGRPGLAIAEAMKARTLGKNSHQAQRANQALEQLAEDPANQPNRSQVKANNLTQGKPTVLIFGATWCAESSQDDALIAHGKKYFGNQVQFIKYNIDDQASSDVVKQFSIGPIPTYIFLNADGSVKSTQLGQDSLANFIVDIESIAQQVH
jgi:alpha-beta hydrolase superfamily lysophospholipase/thiol-disulfide isomerase/thioredoxin